MSSLRSNRQPGVTALARFLSTNMGLLQNPVAAPYLQWGRQILAACLSSLVWVNSTAPCFLLLFF
jgi:hypothetical protein